MGHSLEMIPLYCYKKHKQINSLLVFICVSILIWDVGALSGCFKLDFVLRRARSSCVVAYVTEGCRVAEQSDGYATFLNLRELSLNNNLGILAGFIDLNEKWPDGTTLTPENASETIGIGDVLLFEEVKRVYEEIDPIPSHESLLPLVKKNVTRFEELIDFVNRGCNTYFSVSGSLSLQGLHREEILRTKFYVKNISNVQSKDVFLRSCEEDQQFCYSDGERREVPKLPECDKINLPTKEVFIHEYLKKSRPVIFRNALKDWPAFTKWSNKYLREKYGGKRVKFQLTPHGEFERIEQRKDWDSRGQSQLLQSQADQMPFPDLVLARPAVNFGNFSLFMDFLEGVSNKSISDLSVYLEYASIPEYLPELQEDLRDDFLFDGLFVKDQINIWLSDGRTVGKMHFDASENFLCQVLSFVPNQWLFIEIYFTYKKSLAYKSLQMIAKVFLLCIFLCFFTCKTLQISGKKQVTLIDPHNNHQLYEGHIPEALMSYNFSSNSFLRQELLDSTVYVWTPFDILKPDYKVRSV